MTFGTNKKGEGIITLTPEEVEEFKSGMTIEKASGDSEGDFRIHLRLDR